MKKTFRNIVFDPVWTLEKFLKANKAHAILGERKLSEIFYQLQNIEGHGAIPGANE